MLFNRKKNKVFVIGRNKTGTTSMGQVLKTLGFKIGRQSKAELLVEDWAQRDFSNIIKYCKSADVFQDIPFSLDYTYQAVDQAFPNSKFILTVRGSSEEWYESLTRFHTKMIGKGRLPTADDLKSFSYREMGWLWRNQELIYGIDEGKLYDKKIYTEHYDSYNGRVLNYFMHRPDDLLVLDLSKPNAMQLLCDFLSIEETDHVMPHLNNSRNKRGR